MNTDENTCNLWHTVLSMQCINWHYLVYLSWWMLTFKTLHNRCRIFIMLPPTDLYESHNAQYVIYSMLCHSDTTHENSQVICFNSIQCKCNQPQIYQSTIWTHYIMIVETTSSRNVCCTKKGIIMFKIIFIHDGCQLFINDILVGVKEGEANWFQTWWI